MRATTGLSPLAAAPSWTKDEYGYAYWHVQTDFGSCRFTTHMGGDAVVSLGEARYQITDIDGNRYELPDLYALTVMERKKLDLFI